MNETEQVVHQVAVVGAGVSGIGAAIRLRKEGVRDVVVLEKADDVGGVWRDNTYPGCAVDIPSVCYSYSFAPHDGWSRTFAPQREILDYLRSTAERYGVLEQVRLGVEVLEACWDVDASVWRIRTSGTEVVARSLIAAAGPWHEPSLPDVPGLADFPGPVFHTSRWDHDVDLSGKRVAVVGTGASAVQVVPGIADTVEHLHVFQRTPQWILPKQDKVLEPGRRGSRGALQRLDRRRQQLVIEMSNIAFQHQRGRALLQKIASQNISSAIDDPATRRALTPTWDIGCKRLLMSNDYYPALARADVTLHATGLHAVEGDVLVGDDGSRTPVDVVVLATGFKILEMPIADRVRGSDGRSLAEHWDGSPRAYKGTTVPGFPNLYLIFGPNVSAVTSGFTIVEAQLDQIALSLRHLRSCGAAALEVRPEVEARFNDEVQHALGSTVYNTGGCQSYYFDRNGRNGFSWPWSARRLRRVLADFDPDDYLLDAPLPQEHR